MAGRARRAPAVVQAELDEAQRDVAALDPGSLSGDGALPGMLVARERAAGWLLGVPDENTDGHPAGDPAGES